MITNQRVLNKLLPIAIMAHNEEKVIQKAVESILSQNTPIGYSVKVVIVANGCSDRTEEIVKSLEQQHANKVVLLSIKEKGKTRAINRAISYFDELSKNDLLIPYVIFLDADCEFNGKEGLVSFINSFEQNPKLCAVGADCLPDVVFNTRKDMVAEIYRVTYELSKFVRINSISGGCYGIRSDILNRMDFPNFQLAEDMYVSSRLNGWFYRDRKIKIIFKTPFDLRGEISRRKRVEINTRRYHEYYSHLKKKGIRVELFEKSLSDDYRWWGAMDDGVVKKWFKMKGLKSKLMLAMYLLIRLWTKLQASSALMRIRDKEKIDYWKIIR